MKLRYPLIALIIVSLLYLLLDKHLELEHYKRANTSLNEDKEILSNALYFLLDKEAKEQIETERLLELMHNKNYDLAKSTQRAAKEYKLDPIMLTILINSESSYNPKAKHSLDYVKGLGGVNTKYHSYPLNTSKEQIYASAIIFKTYLDKYQGNYLAALTAYKGISKEGRARAKEVYELYLKETNATAFKR